MLFFYQSDRLVRPLSGFKIIMVLIFLSFGPDGYAQDSLFPENQPAVVIDPGHGGSDAGVRGPDGSLEKTVSLILSRLIAKELEGKYKVVLTRTGDYGLDLFSRTALANHMKADVFISIHTGGSFLHKAGGINIFFFKENLSALPVLGSGPVKAVEDSVVLPWNSIQIRHLTASSALADSLKKRFSDRGKFFKSTIESAPLMVLEGADMPAVLIETGYLTNPTEEKRLNDPEALSHFARGIREGIDDFFAKSAR